MTIAKSKQSVIDKLNYEKVKAYHKSKDLMIIIGQTEKNELLEASNDTNMPAELREDLLVLKKQNPAFLWDTFLYIVDKDSCWKPVQYRFQ